MTYSFLKYYVACPVSVTSDGKAVTVPSSSRYINGILNYTKWDARIDPHDYSYIHNPTGLCNVTIPGIEQTILVLLVLSHPRNVLQREFIRNTWAKQSSHFMSSIRTITVFLLGRDALNETSQQSVDEEAELANDILQENFNDEYLNLTVKTVMGLKWASKYCPIANFVFKTDDDMLINIDRLISYIKRAPSNGFFGGKAAKTTALRSYDNKFYIPRSVYPQDNYPPYCEGLGYLMSMDIVHKLYYKAMATPLFPWEDVYVGILLRQLSIKVTDIPNFFSGGWYFDKTDNMYRTAYALGKLRAYFTFHALNRNEMSQIWTLWRGDPSKLSHETNAVFNREMH